MRTKPNKRWCAQRKLHRCLPKHAVQMIDASTWFLARQVAAVLLHADPCDINVREAP